MWILLKVKDCLLQINGPNLSVVHQKFLDSCNNFRDNYFSQQSTWSVSASDQWVAKEIVALYVCRACDVVTCHCTYLTKRPRFLKSSTLRFKELPRCVSYGWSCWLSTIRTLVKMVTDQLGEGSLQNLRRMSTWTDVKRSCICIMNEISKYILWFRKGMST